MTLSSSESSKIFFQSSLMMGSGTCLRDGISELLPRTLSWGLMLGAPRTRELVELRSGLEVEAAQLAAERIDDAALDRMRTNLQAMEENLEDLAVFVEANARFHREIAVSSGNQVLHELLQSIRSLLRIWVDRALTDEGHARRRLRNTARSSRHWQPMIPLPSPPPCAHTCRPPHGGSSPDSTAPSRGPAVGGLQ